MNWGGGGGGGQDEGLTGMHGKYPVLFNNNNNSYIVREN